MENGKYSHILTEQITLHIYSGGLISRPIPFHEVLRVFLPRALVTGFGNKVIANIRTKFLDISASETS